MATKKNSEAWVEAKRRCRLNEADIQMAKELGMTPKSLIKNIPSANQLWKASVKEWIHDLYEKKFGKALTIKSVVSNGIKGNASKQEKQFVSACWEDEDDLPF